MLTTPVNIHLLMHRPDTVRTLVILRCSLVGESISPATRQAILKNKLSAGKGTGC